MNYRFRSLFVALFAGFFSAASAQTLPDSLPNPDSLSAQQLLDWAVRFSNQAVVFKQEFSNKTFRAVADHEAAEQNWKAAKQDTLTPKTTLDSLSRVLKNAKNEEKTIQKQEKQAAQVADFTNKVVGMDSVGQRKNLRKAYKQVKELELLLNPPAEKPIADVIGAPGVSDSTVVAEKRKEKEKKAEKNAPNYKSYDPAADPMRTPPQRLCSLAVNTRDEFSGETYRETQREELFRYTNELMKKILPPGQPHIVCEAALSNSAGTTASLHLTFQIHDASARKAFGILNKNGVAILKFLDGTTFTVNNLRNDEGVPDASNQVFTYRAQYALDPSILKKIRKNELDKIRVAWSTGYEDYEVQGVDVLMREAKCLFD